MYVTANAAWTSDFAFYQAYRYTAQNAYFVDNDKNFAEGVLRFNVMMRVSQFDEDGNPQIFEWSVMGKNDLPSVDSELGAYT